MVIESPAPDRVAILRAVKDLESLWEHLTISERSRLISLLIERIEHDPIEGNISITLSPTGISRARVTHILNLTNLAPDIQQAILDLRPTTERTPRFREGEIRRIAIAPNWKQQRKRWKRLVNLRSRKPTAEQQSRAK